MCYNSTGRRRPKQSFILSQGFNIPGQTAKWLSESDVRMGKVLIKDLSELVFPKRVHKRVSQ